MLARFLAAFLVFGNKFVFCSFTSKTGKTQHFRTALGFLECKNFRLLFAVSHDKNGLTGCVTVRDGNATS